LSTRWDTLTVTMLVVIFLPILFVMFPSALVKGVGHTLLLAPEELKLVQRVSPDEVISFPLFRGRWTSQQFKPGRYLVFTNDPGLLLSIASAEARQRESVESWLEMRPANDKTKACDVVPVHRGLRPYDTPYAKGRPVLRFFISEAGAYEMLYSIGGRATVVSVVPDRTSGNELLIAGLCLVQVAIPVTPLCLYVRRRWKRAIAIRRITQREQRHRADQLMDLFRKGHAGIQGHQGSGEAAVKTGGQYSGGSK